MSRPAVELLELTKTFPNGHKALDRLTLTVPEGSVFGFLGPNGAGKTTTLRILAGLAHPTAGAVRLFGEDITRSGTKARAAVGFLPDVPGFYPWMTASQFLRFTGYIFGLSGSKLNERVEALLDLAGLGGVGGKIGGFSRGMKQRLGVAQALVNAPRLLMLDEPTSALDPIGRKELLDMVASLRGRTTVFFSTHVLSDVERVCDTVAILNRGRLVTDSPIETLKRSSAARRVIIDVNGGGPALVEELQRTSWVTAIENRDEALRCSVNDLSLAQREIPRLVVDLGLGIRRMEVEEASLEDVFVEMVEESQR